MSQPSAGKMPLWLILGLSALILVTIGLAGVLYFALRTRRPAAPPLVVQSVSHLDKMLGLEPMIGIEDDGLCNPEESRIWKGETFRWTTGTAKLVVPLGDRPPQAVFVRLGLPAPRTVQLGVRVNGKVLYDEKITMKTEWTRTFDVSGMHLGKTLTVEIVSDTVIPAEVAKNSTDGRSLGVALRGIILMSGEQDFAGVLVGAKSVLGVAEEGFHGQEYVGEQPFRWTDGAAKLTVPIHGPAPKLLSLVCTIPDRPDYRVEVKVNGQALFGDIVKSKGDWSIELPLDGVAMEREARIEVASSTIVPSQSGSGSTDGRTLGVRIKRLMLLRSPNN